MSNFVKRLVTALVTVPVAIFMIFFEGLNGILFCVAIYVFAILMTYELAVIVEKKNLRSHLWLTSIAVTLSFVNTVLYGLGMFMDNVFYTILTAIFALFLFALFASEATRGKFDGAFESVSIAILSFVMFGVFTPVVVQVKLWDLSGWLTVILFGIPWLSDAGGLFAGKLFGKHPVPSLASPNKTIEGYFGTAVMGFISGFVFFIIQGYLPVRNTFTLGQLMLISGVLVTTAIIGDLGESMIKRWANVKDSGNFLPGHGGIFDRMDSIIISAPVYLVLLRFMGFGL
ncbi:MAG: hypothetical protein A2Y33_05615 [Spirochaetes bacterium GWF1_51_8]|nr:MAG: hypothetical protein A2Y33_05615 [Spirochaetes bacterium GWF1_51_8]